MSIHDIFKVPVYSTQLNLDIKKLQSFCNEYQQKDTGKTLSNIGGYHSNDLPLNDVSLHPLIKEINTHSSKFAKEFINNNEQALNHMWINISLYKDTNKSHNHPGSDISGVYYVKIPDECGNIEFEHPATDVLDYYSRLGQFGTKSPPIESNEYNSITWWKPVAENGLYLFPGWLRHHVEPNQNKNEERISISFNTIQKGE